MRLSVARTHRSDARTGIRVRGSLNSTTSRCSERNGNPFLAVMFEVAPVLRKRLLQEVSVRTSVRPAAGIVGLAITLMLQSCAIDGSLTVFGVSDVDALSSIAHGSSETVSVEWFGTPEFPVTYSMTCIAVEGETLTCDSFVGTQDRYANPIEFSVACWSDGPYPAPGTATWEMTLTEDGGLATPARTFAIGCR